MGGSIDTGAPQGFIVEYWLVTPGNSYRQEITSDYGVTWTGLPVYKENRNPRPTGLAFYTVVDPRLEQWHRMWDLGVVA